MNLKKLKLDALAKQLGNFDKDDVLDVLGLETRREAGDYLIPGLLVFGAGLAVGCGLGFLLAPRPGSELRGQLGEAIGQGFEKSKQGAQAVRDRISEAAKSFQD